MESFFFVVVIALLPWLCSTQMTPSSGPSAFASPSVDDFSAPPPSTIDFSPPSPSTVDFSIEAPPPPLDFGFYAISCPTSAFVISLTVAEHFQRDPSIAPALLRLVFHDCFVQGCDASVLLASTENNVAERDALPNANSLRGFEIIDEIKSRLESVCPNVVSCADILVLSAREAVVQAGGPAYPLALGRRDGMASFAEQANEEIPSPFEELAEIARKFQEKGFNLTEVVSLLGGHSIGSSHCRFFTTRLYNFSSEGLPDPRLRTEFLRSLVQICPQELMASLDPVTGLDTGSELSFDNSYYRNILSGQALLVVDQELTSTDITASLIQNYAASQISFFRGFIDSMIKLSNLNVLTGSQGQVRHNCSIVNP